jgi:thiamine transport system substrate-binding protein
MHRTALALGLTLAAGRVVAADLTIYTYDSFTSDWGPGPKVEAAYEARCGCDIELVGLEDGVSLLNRLRIEGAGSPADVVLGLDTNLTAEARATGLFAEHGIVAENLSMPGKWDDAHFLPYDFGYFAFVYNRELLAEPPTSLEQLVGDEDGPAVLIQDPRTSTPGLGLLLWMKQVFADRADQAWRSLSPRIVTVTKGWSEAYGLFLKNEAPLVLSYTTSPAYHAIAEQDDRFAAAHFAEGHYQQVEVAGMLAASDQPERARDFLTFMLGEEFQSIIPTSNWMYPAALPAAQLPEAFGALIDPQPVLRFDERTVADNRRAWIDEWLEALSR